MRRKTIGFLILTLVVVAGIVFVERRLSDPGEADAWSEVDSSVYRLVLGGRPPDEGETAAAAASSPSGGASSVAPATGDGAAVRPRPARPATPSSDLTPRPPPNEFRYTLRQGDVLGAVVLAHLGTASPNAIRRVARDSGITDPDRVTAGQKLVIRVDVWEKLEAKGDETIHDLAQRAFGAPGRIDALQLANPHVVATGDTPVPAGTPLWVAR